MCAVPSLIPNFWQLFIFWPCSTVIKCFSEHCFQVFWYWANERSQCCPLGFTLVSQHHCQAVFLALTHSSLPLGGTALLTTCFCYDLFFLMFSQSFAEIWTLRLREQLQHSVLERVSVFQRVCFLKLVDQWW